MSLYSIPLPGAVVANCRAPHIGNNEPRTGQLARQSLSVNLQLHGKVKDDKVCLQPE